MLYLLHVDHIYLSLSLSGLSYLSVAFFKEGEEGLYLVQVN